MNILALIPARSGSKRLPGKNIKLLGGMPLIAWTIRSALESDSCMDILVSTDDPIIADVARKYGANVPWLRPATLATDTANSVDVALHALSLCEGMGCYIDGLLLLQPTSPFRSTDSIRSAIELFEMHRALRPVVSVSAASSHPAWCFRMINDGMEPFLGWNGISRRSQDLEPAWMINGSIYLISPTQLRDGKSFITPDTLPFIIENKREVIDIDTPFDWAIAEQALMSEFLF